MIVPNLNLYNCDSCFGDNLKDSKNAYYCFDVAGIEDSKFIMSEHSKDCYDGIGGRNELCYEFIRTGNSSYITFSQDVIESRNIYYSNEIFYSHDIFGCIGLKNSRYCILNKQYTKEEYEELVPKIIEHMISTGEWGEFFPSSTSPFGYNETIANDFYPLDPSSPALLPKGEGSNVPSISGRGLVGGLFKWSIYEQPFPKVEKVIPAHKIPDDIKEIPDDILNWAIECEVTGKPFRIIRPELEFYRKNGVPIPRKHPDQRHLERMKLRNPIRFYNRNCMNCGKEIKTTFPLERPEVVYCEECYEKATI